MDADHGLTAYVDEAGSAVGVKGDGPREILLLGHIDTFPGEVPVRREGDLLYGRGAVDAKGPLCTFAAAAAQASIPADWRITVVGAVEEECATSKGARYVLGPETVGKTAGEQRGRGAGGKSLPCSPASSAPLLSVSSASRATGIESPWATKAGCCWMSSYERHSVTRRGRAVCRRSRRLTCGGRWSSSAKRLTRSGKHTPFNRLDPSLRHIASRDEGAFGVVELSLGFRLPVGLSLADLEQQLRQVAQALPEGTTTQLQFSGGELAYKGDKSNPLRACIPPSHSRQRRRAALCSQNRHRRYERGRPLLA